MSKSGGNAIPLSASPDAISAAVKAMFTDPNHLRVEDHEQIEDNVVFVFLDAFDQDKTVVEEMKVQYQKGVLGDGKVKNRLDEKLQALLAPIRTRRIHLSKDPAYVLDVIRKGTEIARNRTDATRREVVESLGLFRL